MSLEKAPHLSYPKDHAAGPAAVASSLNHVMRLAGPVKGTKALLSLNQKGGFDCPSCAWPDPDDHRALAEFCENGAKAVASETTTRRIDVAFFAKHPVSELLEQSDYWHDQQGRLTEPMILREGSSHYSPISWDEAFALLAQELQALPTPDDAIFYTSGRTSNEAAFLYQLFARCYGTNNLPDCSNMCHESSGTALKQSIGVGKGTVSLDDIYEADTIICIGQNPGTNHPRMLSALENAVKNGAKIIAINPLKEAGLLGFAHPQNLKGLANVPTPLASLYLQVKVNGDLALLRALAHLVLQRAETTRNLVDYDFITQHTIGFEEYRELCLQANLHDLCEVAGIESAQVEELANLVLRKDRKLITCWAMGLTQHRNAVATIREIANLHLLLGAIGRPGAGLCPVRGHSNVQGDRTMGIFERMPESFHAALDQEFGITSPREHGHDTVNAILAMHQEPSKVFIAMGGNFLQAAPDTDFTAQALQNCRLTCHVATKLNRSHLVTGKIGLILPCLGRSETDLQASGPQFVTCENSMGIVHSSQGKLTPASPHLLSETAIVCRLAEATLPHHPRIPWSEFSNNYDKIRSHIERVIPGFDKFNERVREPGGFYLPNAAKEHRWDTETGKANFALTTDLDQFVPAPGRLILQTLRSHDQFNTTVYGLNDRYRGIGMSRRIIFLNPEDLKERQIKPIGLVHLTSHWHDGERHAHNFYAIPYDIPRGTAAAYFPEANVLVPINSTARESNTPTSKAIEVSIHPA